MVSKKDLTPFFQSSVPVRKSPIGVAFGILWNGGLFRVNVATLNPVAIAKPGTKVKTCVPLRLFGRSKSAELETMRISKNQTTVVTANGEVRTREEATLYGKELELFVTVMFLEETPAVLSLRKLCEDHGYTYHWTSGRKPHLTKNGKRTDCNISNNVPLIVPGLPTSSSATPTPTSPSFSSEDSRI